MKLSFRFWFCIISIFFNLLLLSSCRMDYSHNPLRKELNVDTIPQYKGNWCWAACSQMVMNFLDPSPDTSLYSQCKQAWKSLSPEQAALCIQNTCCLGSGGTYDHVSDSICNHTNWPIFEQFGFRCMDTYTNWNYLSWEDMVHQIDNSKPLCLTYNWTGGGAHMIVMDGYKIDSNNQLFVHLIDPYAHYVGNDTSRYCYTTIRYTTQEENRRSVNHVLGRCYYNIEKIAN